MANIENKKENPLLSLLLNIVLPSLIMTKLSGEDQLGAINAILVAVSFPFAYGVYDFFTRRNFNFISLLGLVSVSLTGLFALYELDAQWLAIKEAAIPALIGLVVVSSTFTKAPLIKTILLNENFMDIELVEKKIAEKQASEGFTKLIRQGSWLLALSFFVSSALNYGLARYLLTAEPGSVEFSEQLGQMTALSWPVIVLPSMAIMVIALWRLISGLKEVTGLQLEEILRQNKNPTK